MKAKAKVEVIAVGSGARGHPQGAAWSGELADEDVLAEDLKNEEEEDWEEEDWEEEEDEEFDDLQMSQSALNILPEEDGRIRFDHNSWRESLFLWGGLIAALMAATFIYSQLDSVPDAEDITEIFSGIASPVGLIVIAAMAAVLCFKLYASTDDHVLYEPFSGRFLNVRTFLGASKESTLAYKDQVQCVVVEGVFHRSENRSYWKYGLTLILRDGSRRRIGGTATDRHGYDAASRCLRWMQEELQLPTERGRPEHRLVLEWTPTGECQPRFVPWSLWQDWLIWLLVAFFLLMAFVLIFG